MASLPPARSATIPGASWMSTVWERRRGSNRKPGEDRTKPEEFKFQVQHVGVTLSGTLIAVAQKSRR
ncbi:hypothetical protein RvY_01371 [Ramazzottius varieornatus]|uniref:Uncharacterized protein n=1 Tax=Ramazzottius varieornatus TaxID=947166 RepID=A0A1D1UM63_RAMVA|nr:hypothetical protein RvY_01371 [Ramazzottius varieornatus]